MFDLVEDEGVDDFEGTQVVKTKAQWRTVVENIRGGRVRYSTGSQQRGAQDLADFIEAAIDLADDDQLIPLDIGWDEALTVHQASGLRYPEIQLGFAP